MFNTEEEEVASKTEPIYNISIYHMFEDSPSIAFTCYIK